MRVSRSTENRWQKFDVSSYYCVFFISRKTTMQNRHVKRTTLGLIFLQKLYVYFAIISMVTDQKFFSFVYCIVGNFPFGWFFFWNGRTIFVVFFSFFSVFFFFLMTSCTIVKNDRRRSRRRRWPADFSNRIFLFLHDGWSR